MQATELILARVNPRNGGGAANKQEARMVGRETAQQQGGAADGGASCGRVGGSGCGGVLKM